jgi:hypothetical protein
MTDNMHKISMGNAEQYIGIEIDELNSIVDGLIEDKHSEDSGDFATSIVYTLAVVDGEITMFAEYEWE